MFGNKTHLSKKTEEFKEAVDKGNFTKNIKFEDEILAKGHEGKKILGRASYYSDRVIDEAARFEKSLGVLDKSGYPTKFSITATEKALNDKHGQMELLKEGSTIGTVRHEASHLREKDYDWTNFEDKYTDAFKEPADLVKGKETLSIDEATELTHEYEYLTRGTEMSSYLGTNFKDVLVESGKLKSVHDDVTMEMVNWATKNRVDPLIRYVPYVKNKSTFLDMINSLPYSVTGVVPVTSLFNNKAKK
jgi:hypothetical protein